MIQNRKKTLFHYFILVEKSEETLIDPTTVQLNFADLWLVGFAFVPSRNLIAPDNGYYTLFSRKFCEEK